VESCPEPSKLEEIERADAILNPAIHRIAHKNLIIALGRLARAEQRRLEGKA
jgi:hypothetical protein